MTIANAMALGGGIMWLFCIFMSFRNSLSKEFDVDNGIFWIKAVLVCGAIYCIGLSLN